MYRSVEEFSLVAGSQEQMPHTAVSPLRLHAAGACVALTGVVGMVAGCGMGEAPAPSARPALEQLPEECSLPADERELPDTARGWARTLARGSKWLTGDAVFSQALPDGRAIFFTSDSIGVKKVDGELRHRFNRNAMIVVCGDKAASVAPLSEAIPSNEKSEWYWPVQSVVKDNKMYVLASRNAKTEGFFPFKHVGSNIAVFDLQDSTTKVPKLERILDLPMSDTPEVGPDGKHNVHWSASLAEKDGDLYVFGGHVYDEPFSFGRNVHVARVSLQDLESPTAWRYWNGSKWDEPIKNTKPIIDTHEQEGQDAAWTTFVAKDGTFTMVGKKDGMLGSEIGIWKSKTKKPEGPYEYKKLAADPIVQPYTNEDCRFNYLAYAQPGLVLKSGKMLVSLSNNIKDLRDVRKMSAYPGDFNVRWIELSLTDSKKNTEASLAPRLQPTATSCEKDYGYVTPTPVPQA